MTLITNQEVNLPWRFEYKYLLTSKKVAEVRNALIPYVEHDLFTRQSPSKRYLVRSLYFDTRFLNFYQEKVDGDRDRLKFRIRSYSEELTTQTTLKAEIKVRKGMVMEKYSTFITADEYERYMRTKKWDRENDPVLIEFERYHWLKCLEPQVLIQYFREGFTTRDKREIRITFDHKVSSVARKTLFPEGAIFREHHKGGVILEIKCRKSQPHWLLDIVKDHGLKIIANSKYARGIEVSKPGVVNPSWSC